MKSSEMLIAIANWLESEENEAILLAEDDSDCLDVVATSCVAAAKILKTAAHHLSDLEPQEDKSVTIDHLEQLATLANKLDESDDEELRKQASVLDQILFTFAASPEAIKARKLEDEKRMEQIKIKYKESQNRFKEVNKLADAEEDVKNHKALKEDAISDYPLQTRTCPEHPGVQMRRISDNVAQCSLDNKVFNYEAGYQLLDGTKVPGGSVSNQNILDTFQDNSSFQTRDDRLSR